jgi:ABC-type nitrate/sulfonate/bicarbonate transport system permease component
MEEPNFASGCVLDALMYVIFLSVAEVHVEAPPRACPTVSEVLARKVDSVQETTIPQEFLLNIIRASNSFVLAVNNGARAEPSDGNKFGEPNQ